MTLHAWPRCVSHSLTPKVRTSYKHPSASRPSPQDWMGLHEKGCAADAGEQSRPHHRPSAGPVSPWVGFTFFYLLWVTELLLFQCNLQKEETGSRIPPACELGVRGGAITLGYLICFRGWGATLGTQRWSRSSFKVQNDKE